MVLHAVQLSGRAVLEVSCKPKLCRFMMTHMNQSNDNRDLENEREIFQFGFRMTLAYDLNIQNKNIINILEKLRFRLIYLY